MPTVYLVDRFVQSGFDWCRQPTAVFYSAAKAREFIHARVLAGGDVEDWDVTPYQVDAEVAK